MSSKTYHSSRADDYTRYTRMPPSRFNFDTPTGSWRNEAPPPREIEDFRKMLRIKIPELEESDKKTQTFVEKAFHIAYSLFNKACPETYSHVSSRKTRQRKQKKQQQKSRKQPRLRS